jgi:predicted AlkP superfamily pyrophosphatase or phosphodiesterase
VTLWTGTWRLVTSRVAWLVTLALVTGIGLALHWIRPTVLQQLGEPLRALAEGRAPGLTEHVILVSIDGLRPDAIARFDARNLQSLMRNGRYSLKARTVLPPKTLPAHASMLTGMPPSQHRITWNSDLTARQGRIGVSTIFDIARQHGLRTAAFFSKTKFEHLATSRGFDFLHKPKGGMIGIWADEVDDAVKSYLDSGRPNLLFVHIADPDYVGHSIGWMTYLYGRAIRTADSAVQTVIEGADDAFGRGNYTLIVTSDHGGHGRDHGYDRSEDVLIPWIVWGAGVKGTGPIEESISTMDTGATVLWLLGMDRPSAMVGRPVLTAFHQRHAPLLTVSIASIRDAAFERRKTRKAASK